MYSGDGFSALDNDGFSVDSAVYCKNPSKWILLFLSGYGTFGIVF